MLQKAGLFVDVALATSFDKHDLQMDRKQFEDISVMKQLRPLGPGGWKLR